MRFLQSSTIAVCFISGLVCGIIMTWVTTVVYNQYSTAFVPFAACQGEDQSDVSRSLAAINCKPAVNINYRECNCKNSTSIGYRDLIAQSHEELELIPKMTTVLTNSDYEFHRGKLLAY